MIRTTITLTPELAAALDEECRRRHLSLSECVRLLVAAQLGLHEVGEREVSFIGVGDSGQTNISEDMEELFEAEWGNGPTYHS